MLDCHGVDVSYSPLSARLRGMSTDYLQFYSCRFVQCVGKHFQKSVMTLLVIS